MTIDTLPKPAGKKRKAKRITGVVVELGNSSIVAEYTGIAPSKPKPNMRLVIRVGNG